MAFVSFLFACTKKGIFLPSAPRKPQRGHKDCGHQPENAVLIKKSVLSRLLGCFRRLDLGGFGSFCLCHGAQIPCTGCAVVLLDGRHKGCGSKIVKGLCCKLVLLCPGSPLCQHHLGLHAFAVKALYDDADYLPSEASARSAESGAWIDVVEYDVWIAGTRVTNVNAADVLGDADEGATVTYDPDTHTLKLDNANITSSDEQYAIYATHDLTIELAGTSTVTLDDPTTTEEPMYGTEGAEGNCVPEVTAAIACEGSLTVKSADASNPGTLKVTDASSSYETESPSAIYATEDVTIRDATVSASSETGRGIVAANFASYDSGVEARSEKANGLEAANATISGGSVTLSSTDGIAMNVAGNLTAVSDCTLTLDGGKGALAAATFDSGGQNWYQWVTSPIGIPAASLNETYSPAGRTDTYLRIEPVGTLYELTVVGGTGSGHFLARNQITISADPVNDSSHFSHWEVDPSGAGTLADPSSATTTFTMPATGATITAVYESHTLAHHDAKSPTCIDTGWNAYDKCTVCGYSTFEETPITGHSWGEDGRCTVCGAIDPDFAPKIIAGANVTWQKGSDKGLTFTSNAAYGDFQKVQVDGRDVDASNYTVEEGSTIVTLKASYLETLSVGKHALGIVSQTGTAETEFTIAAAAQETLASTGDASTPLATPLLVLASALVGAGALVLRRSRS